MPFGPTQTFIFWTLIIGGVGTGLTNRLWDLWVAPSDEKIYLFIVASFVIGGIYSLKLKPF